MDNPSTKQALESQTFSHHPFDVTFVVGDGVKEFKAHRGVLSQASPFFEKLLNGDMRESKEGVVRLEMVTERGLKDILEFIYSGSVQTSTEEKTQELIAMADYFLLPELKAFAERIFVQNLTQKMNVSNGISTYHFAEIYRCRELLSAAKYFILSNFTSVAKTEEFLNMSSKEVEVWISSDEINVSAEEDVFKIILAWIGHDRVERKKCFSQLLRHVRLAYVSSDYLRNDILTNDLVKDNEACLDQERDAVRFIDYKDQGDIFGRNSSVPPRKSLEIPVIVVCEPNVVEQVLCYYPYEDEWFKLCDTSIPTNVCGNKLGSCHGKLYAISSPNILCYDSLSNCWATLPFAEERCVFEIFLRNDDELYAFASLDERSCPECASSRPREIERYGHENMPENPFCGKKHISFIKKYKPETNTWENVASFDFGSRKGICLVARENFVYFLGGSFDYWGFKRMTDSGRYDLATNKWEKLADMGEARSFAYGAAAYQKIFVTAGLDDMECHLSYSCEVYSEITKEWQFIASLGQPRKLLCLEGKLYALRTYWITIGSAEDIQCYDPESDEWNQKIQIPILDIGSHLSGRHGHLTSCSMRIFRGSNFLEKVTRKHINCSSLSQSEISRCAIM